MPTKSEQTKPRFGPYATPQFEYGDVVMDEVRGEVRIVGLTDAPIPWPIGKRGRARSLVIYGRLADAIRNEANFTVAHWWGITCSTVTVWRRALGVGHNTPGTVAALRDVLTPARRQKMQDGLFPTYADEERNEKIRQSKLGRPRSKAVREKIRAHSLGRKWSPDARKHYMERIARRGPKPTTPWTPEEDEFVRGMTILEAAKRTGRTRRMIMSRRAELGISGRANG